MSYTVKRHDRAEQRKNDYKHIMKKKNILKYVYGGKWLDWHTDNETQLHRLSKEKFIVVVHYVPLKLKMLDLNILI